jgi:ssDNA-binding replication factor A large subunit
MYLSLTRCFTRGYIVKKFGLDDLFIAIAVTLGGAQTVTILLEIEHGEGRHSSEVLTEEFNDMLLVWITWNRSVR